MSKNDLYKKVDLFIIISEFADKKYYKGCTMSESDKNFQEAYEFMMQKDYASAAAVTKSMIKKGDDNGVEGLWMIYRNACSGHFNYKVTKSHIEEMIELFSNGIRKYSDSMPRAMIYLGILYCKGWDGFEIDCIDPSTGRTLIERGARELGAEGNPETYWEIALISLKRGVQCLEISEKRAKELGMSKQANDRRAEITAITDAIDFLNRNR